MSNIIATFIILEFLSTADHLLVQPHHPMTIFSLMMAAQRLHVWTNSRSIGHLTIKERLVVSAVVRYVCTHTVDSEIFVVNKIS